MKKPICFLCCAILVVSSLSAQVHEGFAVGVFGFGQKTFGDYTDVAIAAVGGGIAGEYQLPELPKMGASIRMQGNTMILSSENIESYWNIAVLAGLSWTFPLPAKIALRSELSYGLWFHEITLTPTGDESVSDSFFTDVALQASLAIRWTMTKCTVELAPVYTGLMEQTAVFHLAGVRAGLIYEL